VKLVVLDAALPFGADPRAALRAALVRRFAASGVDAEAVVLPFAPEPSAAIELAARSLCLFNTDRVVALAFPATLVPHAAVLAWLHEAPCGRAAEGRALAAAQRVLAADAAVAAAILRRHGIAAGILRPDDALDPLLA
jgi:hypothetical protein